LDCIALIATSESPLRRFPGSSYSILPRQKSRSALERVPEDKFGWKPHEKSMAMDRLVGHIADMPGWFAHTVDKNSLDVAPAGADKNVVEGRAAIARASDENRMKTWTLQMGGKTMFSMPRVVVLRSRIMNHMIHHRAQLGVYLRLNDIPIPATYGPAADEGKM